MRRVLLVSVLLFAALPAAARASCAQPNPSEQLARADAAFVGRLVEVRERTLVFEIDQVIKGPVSGRIEAQDAYFMTSAGWNGGPSQQPVGVFLDQREDLVWTTHGCARTTPELLRAAAQRDEPCPRPRIGGVRVSRRGTSVRLTFGVRVGEGRLRMGFVRWGDGTPTRAIALSRRRRTLDVGHRYPRRGSFNVRITVWSSGPPECGWPASVRHFRLRV